MSDDIFSDLINNITKAEDAIYDGSARLRDDKEAAILDYVVLSDGEGKYKIDHDRCKEVGIDPEEAANKYAELKLKDITNEI